MGIALYFGRNVRLLLKARGWTQTELSERTKLTRQALSRALNSKQPPTGKTIETVAKAFGVEACELICSKPPK